LERLAVQDVRRFNARPGYVADTGFLLESRLSNHYSVHLRLTNRILKPSIAFDPRDRRAA
jgi:hypothetical protein